MSTTNEMGTVVHVALEKWFVTITEADRATARRVIRRHMGVHNRTPLDSNFESYWTDGSPRMGLRIVSVLRGRQFVFVARDILTAAAEAAAQGRAYAAALRGAK